ncbi:MAG: cobyrinate a,c-diamide synthase [Planctomycetota bacterium]
MNKRLVIAGTQSGVGKTSVTLALTRALTRRGLRVQTFKVGPDFLDPSYLALASNRPCYNLDGWMCGEKYVRQLFVRKTADAEIAIIEGVMGLFDGADSTTSEGSTAEIARWLNAPVLLVVNAHGLARSLAAVVKGFVSFEPDLRIAGVIANQCGSDRHAQWLAESLRTAILPPLLGAIPRGDFPALPSRHLGLVTADSSALSLAVLDQMADVFERHVSLDAILAACDSASLPSVPQISAPEPRARRMRLGVAHDAAFHFYYPDTLEALQAEGCELAFFSPLNDARLPEMIDALYLGGGYPEEHAEALAANTTLLQDTRTFAANGNTIYAECGGLMYLAEGIETRVKQRHALAGILPVWTRMLERRKALGYVEVELTADSLWGRRGARVRGHEFHYSEIVTDSQLKDWRLVYSLQRQRADGIVVEGFQRGRILASYVHAHFASRPETIRYFVNSCENIARSNRNQQ